MPANAIEWDARHREAAQSQPEEPSSILLEWLPLLPKGPVLDIACGTGRNTLLLAARGAAVTAVDWSGTGLDILETRARKARLAFFRADGSAIAMLQPSGIRLIQANLEELRLPETSFSLILCFHYLQRALFPQIARALRPGGLLLFETYTRAQLDCPGGPRNPAFLLEPGELRNAFPELRTLFYRELHAGQGIASLVAEKPQQDVERANR